MNRLAALTACAIVALSAAPALADESNFDMRYAMDYQMWSIPNGTGGTPIGFALPMQMFTVTDHTGGVLAAASSVARTEANRMNAENRARDKAVREGRSTYTYSYAQEVSEPHPGLHFGLQVGLGKESGVTNLSATNEASLNARLLRLNLSSDITEVGPGTLAWDAAYSYFQLISITGGGTPFSSTYVPAGVSYRLALPVPVLGALLIEPGLHLDVGRLLGSGFKSFAANDVGVTVAYPIHPQWRVEARLQSARMSQSGGSTNKDDTASVTSLSLGTTMIF